MMKTNNKTPQKIISSLKPWSLVLLLYLLGVIIRFILALLYRHGPTVQIDESLYINIAKSLAANEGLAYRSQPVPYMYIFYPLLLVPLYLIPLPFDLYRVLQLYNCLQICSSIFPVYLFAKDVTGSVKKALLSSAITLLLPDMMMSGFLMAESAVWPLSLWLVFSSYRLFAAKEKFYRYGFLTGLFTALLFWTKPGTFVMGLILLFSACRLARDQQNKTRRTAAYSGLAVCAVCIIFFYGLYTLGFGYKFSLLGLYQKQLTTVSLKWIAAVAEFSILQLFLFAIACGGIFFILPYLSMDRYDNSKKFFLAAFSVGLVVLAIGTAAFVDMHTWNGSFANPQLHLRYMAMYIPVMVVFSLASAFPSERKKLIYLLLFLSVLIVFPGPSVGFAKGESTYIDSVALSSWLGDLGVPVSFGIALSVVSALFFAFLSFRLSRGQKNSAFLCQSVFFLFIFLLSNNICGYLSVNTHEDKNNYGFDAVEMNTLVESLSDDILVLTQKNYDETTSYCLEARLRKPQQQVTEDAFIEALVRSGGVYAPFIPADQDPNVGNHLTPDTDTFLFGVTVDQHVEFSNTADIRQSQHGCYTLAKASSGERLIDTALSGLDIYSLPQDSQAQLYVFNDSRFKNGKLTLHLVAYAENGTANLEIENAGKVQVVSLTEKAKTCLVSLRPGDTVITAREGDVTIVAYSTG